MLWSAPWIEALRARPGAAAVLGGLLFALLWLAVPLLFFSAPPRALLEHLILAREWRATPDAGGPLAAWLEAIAFIVAGIAGVYVLFAAAAVASAWLAYKLARRMLGRAMGGAAALLIIAMLAVGAAAPPFSPDRLALPVTLWLMREAWRLLVEDKPHAWVSLAAAAGAALFTGWTGWTAIAAVGVLLGATPAGRAALRSPDIVRPVVVALTFVVPFLFWAGFALAESGFGVRGFEPWRLAVLALSATTALAGGGLLALLASPFGDRAHVGDVPELVRPPLPAWTGRFLKAFGGWPLLILAILAPLGVAASFIGASVVPAAAIALIAWRGERAGIHRRELVSVLWLVCLVAPPAIAAATVVVGPYLSSRGEDVNFPARAVAVPLTRIVASRTGHPPAIIGGETFLAGALALASPARPAVMPEADPARAPWIGPERFARDGMVVIWRITDRAGEPPFALRSRWPNLQPGTPIVVQWSFAGRLEPVRVGWAIVPAGTAPLPAQ